MELASPQEVAETDPDASVTLAQIQGFKSYRDETVVDPFSCVLSRFSERVYRACSPGTGIADRV
jgi:hypothetical protein